MRKVILFNMISLDGYYEGPSGEISWHNVDEEFNTFAIDQLNAADLLLFGRNTYELMATYWPTEEALKNDPVIANKMNSISKIVFSTKLKKADWANTKIVKENIAEEMSVIKNQPGDDILIFGSAHLLATFIQLDLVDEYRLMINPVALGYGKNLFNPDNKKGHHKLHLELIRTKTFNSGNVLLCYSPIKIN